jgi:stearoyl-CoA desaturase (delta-9 desaturase)
MDLAIVNKMGSSRPIVYLFDRAGIVLIHVGTLLALTRPFDAKLVGLAVIFYVPRMFGITAGYHRYFAHRAFKTNRVVQFLLALLGTSATQKGPLWWAASHRRHHRYSDTPLDVHSPVQKGFWHSHIAWWFGTANDETDMTGIADFAKYPELRFLDRWYHVGVFACMALAFAWGGWDGFLWGYVVSTFAVTHATFAINSLAHVYGSRRYATSDTSRNNWWLALLTLGEGWHNNHHHYMSSANQGFFWWEVDFTYYALKALSWARVVRDLRLPPPRVLSRGIEGLAEEPGAPVSTT